MEENKIVEEVVDNTQVADLAEQVSKTGNTGKIIAIAVTAVGTVVGGGILAYRYLKNRKAKKQAEDEAYFDDDRDDIVDVESK